MLNNFQFAEEETRCMYVYYTHIYTHTRFPQWVSTGIFGMYPRFSFFQVTKKELEGNNVQR